MRRLREELPQDFLVIGNASFPTLGSFFYEYDIILATVDLCDVLEVKLFSQKIEVQENYIRAIDGFTIDRVFSILEDKTKVLSSRIQKPPFARSGGARISSGASASSAQRRASHGTNDIRTNFVVVVPDGCEIKFEHAPHRSNRKVMTLNEAVKHYKGLGKAVDSRDPNLVAMRNGWRFYRNEWTSPGEQTQKTLGRFYITKASDRTRMCASIRRSTNHRARWKSV